MNWRCFFCESINGDTAIQLQYETIFYGIIDGSIVLPEILVIKREAKLNRYRKIIRNARLRKKAYLKHCFDNAIAPRRWVPPSRLTKKEILDGGIICRPIF